MNVTRAVALSVILGMVAIVVIMDVGFRHDVMIIVSMLPGKDTTVHFLLMGLLCAAAVLGFPDARIGGRRLGVIGMTLVVSTVVSLEELSQAWIPMRTASLRDLMASYAGILLAAVIAGAILRRRTRSAPAE